MELALKPRDPKSGDGWLEGPNGEIRWAFSEPQVLSFSTPPRIGSCFRSELSGLLRAALGASREAPSQPMRAR